MTEESRFLYLDSHSYELLHSALAAQAAHDGEPIPSFHTAKHVEIDALVKLPQGTFAGRPLYPTLEEKAAIIFYTINKKQIFLNGNKRMSTLALLVFLAINDHVLSVSPDDLTAKALWLANTASLDFPAIKDELVLWIRKHTTRT